MHDNNVITLILLHPYQLTPVRSWMFEQEDVIRIGRSVKNHVVLYSAVVSRHHLELRLDREGWRVVNLGTNGTYVDGDLVTECRVKDGQIIHIALSGPKIQLRIQAESKSEPSDESVGTPSKAAGIAASSETPTANPSIQDGDNSEIYEDTTVVDSARLDDPSAKP
ncbi:MAG: FHA domain-containing protein [Microcoleaceae cyanobacterium]